MAEENISFQKTPTTLAEDGLRRNSTGKSVSSNSSEKVLPHYLRASTGSCHDFCKYGRKHAFEEKVRHPIMKRAAPKPNNSRSSVDSVASLGRKKSSAVKTHSPNPPSITRSLDSLNFLKGDVIAETKTPLVKLVADSKPYTYESQKSIKPKVSASTRKLEVSSKKGLTEAKLKNSSGKQASSLKPKSAMGKPSFSGESVGGLNRNGEMKIGKRTGTSQVALKKVQASLTASLSPTPSQAQLASLNMKQHSFKKVQASLTASLSPTPSQAQLASLNMKQHSFKKVASPPKSNNEIRNAEPAEPVNNGLQEKTLYVVKMENDNTLELSQIETCAKQEEYVTEMENESNILESFQTESSILQSYQTKSNILESFQTESSILESYQTKSNILESYQNETCTTKVELLPHPSLLSPEPSSSPDLLSSSPREEEEGQQESEYTISESEDDTYSENSDAVSVENSEMLDTNDKMHKRLGLDYAQDEDEKAMKLKFRRGKVVEMQPENNAPRRLKFRRGRVLDNHDVNAARRRRYNRREDVDDDCTAPSAEKVVLKHQDVQGKKDAQGLFNNVIEETASKLVETRKSKVKALVGAFETVISLQDKKPPSNTAN